MAGQNTMCAEEGGIYGVRLKMWIGNGEKELACMFIRKQTVGGNLNNIGNSYNCIWLEAWYEKLVKDAEGAKSIVAEGY